MAASSSSALRRLSLPLFHRRNFSSSSAILSGGDSSTILTSREKTRAALYLLKSEKNPERILDICRAASLTPESHLDRIVFSTAISKLSRSSYFEGIRRYLEDLKTSRLDLKDDHRAYAIILYGQAGMLDDAIATFEQLDTLGIERSVKTLNSLLLACILAKRYDQAQRIFVDFPKRYNITPELDTYNTVIKAFAESGSTASGYSILESMEAAGIKPNMTTFRNLIEGFYAEEKFDDVGKVLMMMEHRGIKPHLGIYNVRIQSLCKLSRSDEAKALMDGMIRIGIKPNSDSYYFLVYGFCKEGKLKEAKKMFDSMTFNRLKPTSSCYFTILYFLAKGGEYETALGICKESIEKNWVPNFTTVKMIADGLASVGKVEEARELIGMIKERFPNKSDSWKETEESLPQ